ncbi:MAG: argininosuccinate lyase [Chloroflexi bacterium]|nr:argininosuccinate lyase [Chloroflexota bacterium]
MTMVFARAGIRFKEDFDKDLAEYHYPYGTPEEVPLQAEPAHQFDKAHTIMLVETGNIPRDDGVAILRALRDLESSGRLVEQRLATGQGFYAGEALLIERLGREVGGRIHTARATGCFRGVIARWLLRERLLASMAESVALREIMLDLARAHVETVMPGYSHDYRHTVAITFGHYLLSWTYLLHRDFERLAAAYERSNWSPAGTLAAAGSEIPIDQERVADLLGFSKVYENARDATRNYDYVLEAESALAIFHTTLVRLAEDLDLWSSVEFDMVEVADRYCITSSLLPQKKNPWVFEAVRGKHSQLLGIVNGAFTISRAPSDFYNTALWDLTTAAQLVLSTARLMRGVMSTLAVKPASMRRLAGADWAQASDLAAAIVVETGHAFRTAHQIVGLLVRLCKERGIDPDGATPALLDEAAASITGQPLGLSEAVIRRALDPRAAVDARAGTGGTAPVEVRKRIDECAQRVERDREQVARIELALADAQARLERAVDGLLAAVPAG